jgi:RNA recognition motif-containing protein
VRPISNLPSGGQRSDPIAQRGLLGAAPPGVRPIQIPIPPSPKKVSNDWDSRSKPQPTSTPSVTSVPNTKVDADDPKGLKRQYRQSTPSLTIVVKNLPLNSGYRDVRKFFQGCEIPWDGLKMINDEQGKRIGVAYINFCSSQAYFEALERTGNKMEDNSIEVKSCKQEEYDKAIDSFVPAKDNEAKKPRLEEPTQPQISNKAGEKEFVILVKGWATCVNTEELKKFFKDVKIADNGAAIYIEHDPQRRPTGMAMVKFERETDYITALGMDLRQLAGKIVHIKPATQIELNDFIQRQSKIDNQTKNLDVQVASGDEQKCNYTCIHLQGLPAYVTLQDLQYTFFNGLEFGTRGMQLVLDSNGKSLGEAFAEFVSESECALALKKDGEIFMRKQVAVKPIMKTEMLNLLRMIKQPAGRVNSGPQFGRRSTYYVKTENWPFTISIREVISFFQGFNPIQETVRVQIGNDMQGSAAMVGFRSQEDADRAVSSLNKKYYRQRPIRMEPALM